MGSFKFYVSQKFKKLKNTPIHRQRKKKKKDCTSTNILKSTEQQPLQHAFVLRGAFNIKYNKTYSNIKKIT